jgi:hypothetical protein
MSGGSVTVTEAPTRKQASPVSAAVTWHSGQSSVDPVGSPHSAHVVESFCMGPMSRENLATPRGRLHLPHNGAQASALEPELEAANAREERTDAHHAPRPSSSASSTRRSPRNRARSSNSVHPPPGGDTAGRPVSGSMKAIRITPPPTSGCGRQPRRGSRPPQTPAQDA